MYTPEFARGAARGHVARDFPALYALFVENNTGLSGHGLPALVVQGGQDVIVRDPTQERFVRPAVREGSDVQYLNVRDARHRDTRPAGFDAAVAWIFDRAAGLPAPSTCAPAVGRRAPPVDREAARARSSVRRRRRVTTPRGARP
jgi:hypothetical protein